MRESAVHNTKSPFGGIIVPTLTPLTREEELDADALKRQVDFLLGSGVDALFPLGSNGEGAMLRSHTRADVVAATVKAAAGRVPVLCAVLEISTARIIDEIKSFAGQGISAYVVTTPLYYSGFNKKDLVRHFEAIAMSADAPILLYNIPQSTGHAMSESLIRALAEVDNIIGLKDSSGDWAPFQSLLLDRPNDHFALLQGSHELSAISLIAGADGLVPGYANMLPSLFVDIWNATSNQNISQALALQARLDKLLKLRGRANIHANKILSSALGLMDDTVTQPLPTMDSAAAEELVRASAAAGLATHMI